MSVEENTNFVDYYALLGVRPDAEPRQIRVGYVQMAKQHHPDTGGSTEKMQQLNMAYRTLMAATSRKAYDMLHSFHTGATASEYRVVGDTESAGGVGSDEYVDFFIDSVFAEYSREKKPKKSVKAKVKSFFTSW